MTNRTKLAITLAGAATGLAARNMYQRSKERDISGDVVLITGGSCGLGLALARRLADEGCRVAICARDEGELSRTRENLSDHGSDVIAIRCDVTMRTEVEEMIRNLTSRFGRIDILVNNADSMHAGMVESMTVGDFEYAMKVMFWGTVYPSLTVLPAFLARNGGRIVNITSVGGNVRVPNLLPYTCAKNAALSFSEELHAELAETGVVITTIAFSGHSMDARRVAREVVSSIKRGDTEKTFGASANSRVIAYGPGVSQNLVSLAARVFLPMSANSRRSRVVSSLLNPGSPQIRALLFLGRIAARRLSRTA